MILVQSGFCASANLPEECGNLTIGKLNAPLGIGLLYESLDVLLRLVDDGSVVPKLEHAKSGCEYGQDEDHGVTSPKLPDTFKEVEQVVCR